MIWRASMLLAAGIALATSPASADPSGAWEFRTEIDAKGCTITGIMTIDPLVPGSSVRECRFFSAETCGTEDDTPTEMEQACRVIQQAEFLIIRSEVVASLTDGVPVTRYMPDHFTVRPSGPGRMSGTWFDRIYSDHVEFWRSDGGATS